MLTSLPLRSIYIPDNTNVVHFERSQQVKESCLFELYFTEEEMQSVFPSLQVEIRNQEEVVVNESENVFSSVSLEGGEQLQQNINKASECFQDASIETIIEFYVGSLAKLQIKSSPEIICTIIGLQEVEEYKQAENQQFIKKQKILNIIDESSCVKRIPLNEVEGITSVDEGMSNTFLRSLSLVNFQRKNSWKVTIFAEVPNNGKCYTLNCQYSLSIKTSNSEGAIHHKIRVNKLKTECRIQTMILVTNNSSEDWSEVTLKHSKSENSRGLKQINILQGQCALLPYGSELVLPCHPVINQGKLYLRMNNETECRILLGLVSLYLEDKLTPVVPCTITLEPNVSIQFELDIPSLCKITENVKETLTQKSSKGVLNLENSRLERLLEKKYERTFELTNHSDQDYDFECCSGFFGATTKSHTADSVDVNGFNKVYKCLVAKDSTRTFQVVDTSPTWDYDSFSHSLGNGTIEILKENLILTDKQIEILHECENLMKKLAVIHSQINGLHLKITCETDILSRCSNHAQFAEYRRIVMNLSLEQEKLAKEEDAFALEVQQLRATFPTEVEFKTMKPVVFHQTQNKYQKLASSLRPVSFLPSTRSTFFQQQAYSANNNGCLFGTKSKSAQQPPASPPFRPFGFGGGAINTAPGAGQPTSSGLFGNTNASAPSGGGLFGGSGLFGNTNTSSGGSLFGNINTSAPSGGSGLFGNTNTSAPSSSGLFGNTNTSNGGSGLFGNTNTSAPSSGGGLFGNTNASAPSSGSSLFGNTNTSVSSGGGLFGNTNTSAPSSGGLFGNTNTSATSFSTGTSTFGNTTTPNRWHQKG